MARKVASSTSPPSPESVTSGGVCFSLPGWGVARLHSNCGSPGSQRHSEQPQAHHAPPTCVWPATAVEWNGCGEIEGLEKAGMASRNATQRYTDNLPSFTGSPPNRKSEDAGHPARFYHAKAMLGVLANVRDITEQARRLIRLAELAYGARNYDALSDVTAALACLSYQLAQDAAAYYRAVLMKRAGHSDVAERLLSSIITPRATLTLATIYETKGQWAEAARLHLDVMRSTKDSDGFAFVGASLQLATIRSVEGDHAGSLASFESLWPSVKAIVKTHAYLYPLWCNALAVEFAELGRIEEARAASDVAIASPLAPVYPEWRETAAEVAKQQPAKTIIVVSIPADALDAEERPCPRIQAEKPQLIRLPLAPPVLIIAQLLTCAPIHGPPFRF